MGNKTKLILILLLALALRSAGIASRPIWYDEAFSILLSEQGTSAIIGGTLATDADTSAAEEHPPLYYFILSAWIKIFGNSFIAARALSVFASLGSIVYIYLIANHLFNKETAEISALMAAVLPFQVHYGQEARMYGLLAFWLCIATYALLKRQWILFSITAALAQYTHNLAVFYLIPLAFTPVFQKDWKTLRSLTLAGFAAIIMYSPWLIHLPAQLSKVTTHYWVERPGMEKIFTLILMYLPHLPLPDAMLLPGLLFASLTVTLAVFQTFLAWKNKYPGVRWGIWLAYLAFMPPLFLWVVSQFVPVFIERALLPSHAIFCIWLAWAFTQSKLPRPIQLITSALIFASTGIGLYQHITYKGFPYGPYAALDQSIQSRLEQEDVIIHSSKLTYLPSFYFDRELPQSYLIDAPGSSTDTLSPATQKILRLTDQENIETASANATRVWFIIYQQSIEEFTSQGFQTHPDIEYLNTNFILTSTEILDDVRLYIYTRRAP